MFDSFFMFSEKVSDEEVVSIEKNVNQIVEGFGETIERICKYVHNLGYERESDPMFIKIILKRMSSLIKDIEKNILKSINLVEGVYPGTLDELKKERLDFYKKLSFLITEIAYNGIVCINCVIPSISDEDERKKEADQMADYVVKCIVKCIKVAAVHGINIRAILDSFIDLKNQSFMSFESASINVRNAKRMFEQNGHNVFEVNIQRSGIQKDTFIIKVGSIDDKNGNPTITVMPYNPYGFDQDLFEFIGNETIFLDMDEKIQKGYIPENTTQKRVLN